MTHPSQSNAVYEVSIDRYALWRVLDMPGLARIDLDGKTAVLRFETAAGCEPAGLAFVADEVTRLSGNALTGAREAGVVDVEAAKWRRRAIDVDRRLEGAEAALKSIAFSDHDRPEPSAADLRQRAFAAWKEVSS